jgi:hypothetical protein
MSWVQFHDEVWPVTDGEARLRVHVRAPDVGCPRLWWTLDLFHAVKVENAGPDEPGCHPYMNVEISELGFRESDWRRLSGLEIRADAAWHEANEYVNEYGQLHSAEVTAHVAVYNAAAPKSKRWTRTDWVAHDFIARLGTRDGWCFPCELDAWLIPREKYYRKKPESAAELARFDEGPPNLRVITRAIFSEGAVDVPHCADDPVAAARRFLREQTGCESLHCPEVKWASRTMAEGTKFVQMPGWRSTVSFSTEPKQ